MRILAFHHDGVLPFTPQRREPELPVLPLQFEMPTGMSSYETVMAEMAEARMRFNAGFTTNTKSTVDSVYEAPPRNEQ